MLVLFAFRNFERPFHSNLLSNMCILLLNINIYLSYTYNELNLRYKKLKRYFKSIFFLSNSRKKYTK